MPYVNPAARKGDDDKTEIKIDVLKRGTSKTFVNEWYKKLRKQILTHNVSGRSVPLPQLSIVQPATSVSTSWDISTLPIMSSSSSSIGTLNIQTSGGDSTSKVAICPRGSIAHGFNRLYVSKGIRSFGGKPNFAMTGLELYCRDPDANVGQKDDIVGAALNERKRENVSTVLTNFYIF